MVGAFKSSAVLAFSFWEKIKGIAASTAGKIGLGLIAAFVIAILVMLCLLSIRRTLVLKLEQGKSVRKKVSLHTMLKEEDLSRIAGGEGAILREGYRFVGWCYDAEGKNGVGKVFRMPGKSVVLYAVWQKVEKQEQLLPAEEEKTEAAAAAEGVEKRSEEEDRKEIPQAAAAEPSEAEKREDEAEEEADEDDSADTEEAGEGDEIDNALVTLVSGAKVFVQYRRSFTARLIQSAEETKEMYNQLRSEILSYLKVKERVSWNYDSFNVGRKQFAKINANTKSLILYLALDPAKIDEKYNFRDVSEKKRYANVPVRYKITGSRSLKFAIELLEQAAGEQDLDFKRVEEYLDIPYEEREPLIKRKLIKVYAKRETGEDVTEEQLEQYIAEGATVEKMSAYTVTDQVSVNEAESLITDSTAKQLIALADSKEFRTETGKRTYINLDTISANFKDGETVDLETLKARGLIDKKAAAYKVLARGVLDKALTIEARDFSLAAVKMIVLTGGKVVKLRKN